jgi:hypothetical protein
MEFEEILNRVKRDQELDPGEENFLLLPPRLLGYATREKVWAQFNVDQKRPAPGKQPKRFWDTLQIDRSYKNMLASLVLSRDRDLSNGIEDVMQPQGVGAIVMLHGALCCLSLHWLATPTNHNDIGAPGVGKSVSTEQHLLLIMLTES